MAKAMEQQGESTFPDSPGEAHNHMVGLLHEALTDDKSAITMTMKQMPEGMLDLKYGMMNLDTPEKGLVMLAFAMAHMNKKSKRTIEDDLEVLEGFVKKMLE